MTVKWLYNEESDTIGHVSKLKIDGIESISPHHAQTINDIDAINTLGIKKKFDSIAVAGESLNYATFQGIGKQATITDSLIKRLQ